MQVTANVRVVPIPSESAMHTGVTNVYLVGSGQVLAIDSGEALDHHKWMLRGYLAATEQTEIALTAITHHHFDHSGNLKWVHEFLHSDVLVHERGIPLLKGKLPPPEAVRILNQQINQAMQSEAGKDYLLKRGLLGFPGTPQDLQALQARDTDRWGRAIKAAGMEPQ